ncbi:MAG: cell division protein FtsZ [Rhodobiaceae bacterium]|nr:cell division protein FtsZ [Rhodobiaceae bacterium]
MTINLKMPDITELKPRIVVFGVGGGGCNAVNNMIASNLDGVDFVVANTDAQALTSSRSDRIIQMGVAITEGLGAGSQPEIGRAAAEEAIGEITDHLQQAHMAFVTAGMGGGTGTGAAPVIAKAAREAGILTVGVVTKPFQFEGPRRMAIADQGIEELQKYVDTLIVIPNQNLFRVANEKTTFAEAFALADQVLYSGVACITDLMVKEGLINLDFADVRTVMRNMGKAMMGTGEASGDDRATKAAAAAIANPLLEDASMKGAKGLLISITGGNDLTLFEVDEAASRIRSEVDTEANVILGATFDDALEGVIRVSVVATGIDGDNGEMSDAAEASIAALTEKLRNSAAAPRPSRIPEIRAPIVAEAEPLPDMPAMPVEAEPVAPVAIQSGDHTVTLQRKASEEALPIAETTIASEPHYEEAREFIPPVAERPEAAARVRMPQVEDFPPIAQREIARHRAAPEAATESARRPNLLQRLVAAGMGRPEDEHAGGDRTEPRAPAVSNHDEPVSEFAKQARTATPDRSAVHAPRPVGVSRTATSSEDDQYEIPAFLRRQSM